MVTGLWRGSGGMKGQGRGERILVYGWNRWARREGSDDFEEDVIRNGQGLKSTEHSNIQIPAQHPIPQLQIHSIGMYIRAFFSRKKNNQK